MKDRVQAACLEGATERDLLCVKLELNEVVRGQKNVDEPTATLVTGHEHNAAVVYTDGSLGSTPEQ